MQFNILLKRTLIIVFFAVFLFFLPLLLCIIFKAPIRSSSASLIENINIFRKQTNVGLPTRLKIPKINVDTVVAYTGLNSIGEMDTPKTPDSVVWFDLGPRPGDIGSAVIAGHYGPWKSGEGSVFDNLNKLEPGDKIYIEGAGGEITTFVVREFHTYDKNENVSEVFSSNDGKAHLNLVTCSGAWEETQKTYSNRLVIFTDKE